jgi:hypothetical protein
VGNPSALRDPVVLAVGALAVHRLTRLLVDDEVTRPLRDRVDRLGDRAGYLAHCPRCVSVHVAIGWAALAVAAPAVATPAGAALAWSAVSGFLSSWE